MKKNLLMKIFSISFVVYSVFVLFSCASDSFEFFPVEENNQSILQVEKSSDCIQLLETTEISSALSEVYVRTDVPKANIYLNNIYQGRSPLIIKNLVPGYYQIKIEYYHSSSEKIIILKSIELESHKKYEFYVDKTLD